MEHIYPGLGGICSQLQVLIPLPWGAVNPSLIYRYLSPIDKSSAKINSAGIIILLLLIIPFLRQDLALVIRHDINKLSLPSQQRLLEVLSQRGTLRQGELICFHLHTPHAGIIPSQPPMRSGRRARRAAHAANPIWEGREHGQNAFPREIPQPRAARGCWEPSLAFPRHPPAFPGDCPLVPSSQLVSRLCRSGAAPLADLRGGWEQLL